MKPQDTFQNSRPIWESRLACLLFLPVGFFFAYMILHQPPQEYWLSLVIGVIVVLFTLASAWIAFGSWKFQELTVDWKRRHGRVKEGIVFYSRQREFDFLKVSSISVEERDYSESTVFVVWLQLDRMRFPIFEYSEKADAVDKVAQLEKELSERDLLG